MNFSKCERCGCFFASANSVCPKCAPKDHLEIITLKNYLSESDGNSSVSDICIETGISEKNVNRYLKSDDLKNYLSNKGSTTGNISINL